MSVTLSQGTINNSRIAKIKNTFVEHARFELTSRQQKILLYLIANIDNRLDNFYYQDITFKEIEVFLKTDTQSKWGDANGEISNFILEKTTKEKNYPVRSHVLMGLNPKETK